MPRHRWDAQPGSGELSDRALTRPAALAGADADVGEEQQPSVEADPIAPWDAADFLSRPQAPLRGRGKVWGLRALLLFILLAAGIVTWRVASAAHASPEVVTARQTPASAAPGAASASSSQGAGAAEASGTASSGASVDGPAAGTPSSDASGASGVTAPAGASVHVHVAGAVKKPGLYVLPADARAQDAVTAAGGAVRGADLDAINLAAPVQDGTQLRVPRVGEATSGAAVPTADGSQGGNGAATNGAGGQTGQGGSTTAVIQLNSADATQLQELPGIGPALAERLIEWRTEHGRFGSEADLDAVPGIGPAMLAKLRGKVGYD